MHRTVGRLQSQHEIPSNKYLRDPLAKTDVHLNRQVSRLSRTMNNSGNPVAPTPRAIGRWLMGHVRSSPCTVSATISHKFPRLAKPITARLTVTMPDRERLTATSPRMPLTAHPNLVTRAATLMSTTTLQGTLPIDIPTTVSSKAIAHIPSTMDTSCDTCRKSANLPFAGMHIPADKHSRF